MTVLRSIVLVGICLAGLCGSVRAEQTVVQLRAVQLARAEKVWLTEHPKIAYTYADSFEPQLIVPGGNYSGNIVYLVDELSRRSGTGIKLNAHPVTELIEKARAGEKIHPCAMAYAEIE